jgi:hypothetical protein
VRPKCLAYVAAIGIWQPDVEHQQVWRLCCERLHGLATARGRADVEGFVGQRARHNRAQVIVVLADANRQRTHDQP